MIEKAGAVKVHVRDLPPRPARADPTYEEAAVVDRAEVIAAARRCCRGLALDMSLWRAAQRETPMP